jgi:hypothetical protein
MPKKRFTTNRGGYGGASRRSYQQQQQQQPKTFRNQNLSPLETISQTSRTLRTLKRDGTFDRIRRRLIESILQNETLKTYAQFAVTASSRIMSLRMQQRENNGSNKEEEEEEKLRVDAATKMAIKRELEMDLSREVSHAAWNVLAERDGPVPREVQSEIFRERKMRFERAEKRREKKKSEKTKKNKSSKISGRKKTRRKSVGFDAGAA